MRGVAVVAAAVVGASTGCSHSQVHEAAATAPDAVVEDASLDATVDGTYAPLEFVATLWDGTHGDTPWCSGDGWCWSYPLPEGNALHGVWTSGSNDAWMVGDHGTILHWDGVRWAGSTAVEDDLFAVFGTAVDDAWAVGDHGAILHWDGATWSRAVATFDERFVDVWTAKRGDIWIGGIDDRFGRRAVHRWDGTRWTVHASAGDSIRGTAIDDVWASTANGAVHWNGTGWTDFAFLADAAPTDTCGVWASTHDDVWGLANGRNHWNGTAWTFVEWNTPGVCKASGTAADDVWAVGTTIEHWDGSSWTANDAARALFGETSSPSSVAMASANDGWIVGGTTGSRWNGTEWSRVLGDGYVKPIYGRAILCGTRGDLWKLGRPMHFDGTGWHDAPVLDGLLGLSCLGPNDLWSIAADETHLQHGDGTTWTTVATLDHAVRTLWAMADDDVWLTGDEAAVFHWDGARLTSWSLAAPVENADAVSGTSASDVWVTVGALVSDAGPYHSTPYHWDGSSWTASSFPIEGRVATLWSSAPDDVWAAGPALMHWDGSAWTVVPPPDIGIPGAFAGTSPNDVWAISSSKRIAHWDGKVWTSTDSGTDGGFDSIWVTEDAIWVAGGNSVLRHAR